MKTIAKTTSCTLIQNKRPVRLLPPTKMAENVDEAGEMAGPATKNAENVDEGA